jgi:hypothetical protein
MLINDHNSLIRKYIAQDITANRALSGFAEQVEGAQLEFG